MPRDYDDEDDEYDRPRRRRRPRDDGDEDHGEPRDRRRNRLPSYDDVRDDYDDDYRPGHRRNYRPHRGGTILTLSIVSLCCFGFILGTIAFLMGKSDLDAMSREEMDPDGRGITTAGMVIGLISAILSVLLIVVRIGMINR